MSLLSDPECVSLYSRCSRLTETDLSVSSYQPTDTQPPSWLSTQRQRRPIWPPPDLLQPLLFHQPVHQRRLARRRDQVARARRAAQPPALPGRHGRRARRAPPQHLGLPRCHGPQVHAHHPRPVPHGRARHERQRAPPRWLETRAERRLGGGGPRRCGGHGGDVGFCLGWHYYGHGKHGEHDCHYHPRDRDGCHCVEVAAAWWWISSSSSIPRARICLL
jgi:hypothetical protein